MLNRRHIAHQPLASPQQVFSAVEDAQASDQELVLVILVGQINGGPRAPGALMAVLDTGARVGSLSSGCVEAAIAAEARGVLAAGKPRQVRFGLGSQYIDIRLPCGAGMDLLFVPRPDPASVRQVSAMLRDRRSVELRFSADGRLSCTDRRISSATDSETLFVTRYEPDLRLIVAGHGAEADALVRQARTFGAIVEVLTPDEELREAAIREGVSARLLEHSDVPQPIDADSWTAIAIMFHDHDWEPALLNAALDSTAFWIGAMGSTRTARQRRTILAQRGFDPARIARIRGPIGKIASARDPSTLALSALADIVARFGELRN